MRDEGGLHWYNAHTFPTDDSESYIHGALAGMAQEEFYKLVGTEFIAEPSYIDGNTLILTDTGWASSQGILQVTQYNSDGSILLRSIDSGPATLKLAATETQDLAGQTVASFFSNLSDVPQLANRINPQSRFTAGAKLYKLRPTAINDYYEIWFNPGDEGGRCPWDTNKLAQNYGGNCETVDTWGPNQSYEGAHAELNELFSADVAPNAEGFRSVWLAGNNLMHIGAQLLNDAAKTVRFYQLDGPNGPVLLATGNWSSSKLPYLSSDDGAIILPLPQAALDTGHFEKGVRNLLMVKQAGFIRQGSMTPAGAALQDSFNVLNGPAHSQVAEALKPSNASACTSTTDSIAHLTPDRTVRSIALAADGTAYLGGDFTRFATATGSGVVLNTSTGAPRNFPKVDGHVFAVVGDGAGGWYIGGNFGAVGCEPRSNLAHISQDGTLSPWQPTTNGAVRSLVAFENSIAIGGEFDQVNGQNSPYFALLDTSGTAHAITMHPNAPVYALARQENGNLVLGGEFTQIGAQARGHLASISLMFISGRVFNLAELTDWSPQTNQAVNALAVAGDSVLVGGTFTEVNSEPVAAFAEITAEGLIGPLTSALSLSGKEPAVHALAVGNGTVYLGGVFESVNGSARNHIAAATLAGQLTDWNPQLTGNGVFSLATQGNTLYLGGDFSQVNGQTRSLLAAVDSQANLLPWDPNIGGYSVRALALADGAVYAGGVFNVLGPGLPRTGLAAVSPTGAITEWNPAVNGVVNSLLLDGERIYVGGAFDRIGDVSRSNLAAVGTDGSLQSWAPRASGQIATMALKGDVVYLGGGFEAIDDIPHYFLAGVSKSGVVQDWHAWLNGWVNTLAFDGNTLYLGGYFYEAYGLFRNHLAAIDFTEQSPRLTDWAPDVNGLVNTLTLMDNSIAVGGYFTEVNQQPRQRFVALDKQGAVTPLDAKLNGYNVYSLEAARNGIYIGGGFTQASGATRLNSVKLLPDGTLSQWYPGPRFEVHAIQQQNGWVYRGGYGFFEIVRDVSEDAPDT